MMVEDGEDIDDETGEAEPKWYPIPAWLLALAPEDEDAEPSEESPEA